MAGDKVVERKFVCPECGADVVWWDEMVHDNIRKIHPISGMVYKHFDRSPEEEVGNAGVKCTNCDWYENLISSPGSDEKWKDLSFN